MNVLCVPLFEDATKEREEREKRGRKLGAWEKVMSYRRKEMVCMRKKGERKEKKAKERNEKKARSFRLIASPKEARAM